jgi:hypothetical protein
MMVRRLATDRFLLASWEMLRLAWRREGTGVDPPPYQIQTGPEGQRRLRKLELLGIW